MTANDSTDNRERLRRWRLILGSGDASLNKHDKKLDSLLSKLYGTGRRNKTAGGGTQGDSDERSAGLGASMPEVSTWLGDIRDYFPDTVVEVMQQDMIDKIGLKAVLSNPEALENMKPDVSLVSALLMLKETIPQETKHTARLLVQHVVRDLLQRLKNPMQQAIRGALNRAQRKRNPKHNEIDWDKTIRANLKHYQTDYNTIIPEMLIGYGRRRQQSKHHVIICIDQSGSMASSMVYASIFGAVMASIPALKTSMVLFDTSVVDMTPHLADPVDVLFGTMLGGGTDINRAVGYCQTLIERPDDTVLVLITDLYEGGSQNQLLQRVETIVQSGVQMITLLALSDSGTPYYDKYLADEFAKRGVVSFACTPDLFPELMAATMNKRDISAWATEQELAHIFSRDDV